MIAVLSFIGKPTLAQTSSYGELQAAYMYNFAKYIKWPQESQNFIIGVYGDAEIMHELQTTLKEKKIGGKEVVLRKVTSTPELAECHIIYLSESNSKNLGLAINAIANRHVLIVTEEDLIRKGAIISFVIEDDKLRFKLKQSALSKAGLVASEGLLRLAILF